MITFKHKGDFKNTEKFLSKSYRTSFQRILNKYGQEGVDALASATPVDTGGTASMWVYKAQMFSNGSFSISWDNTNINDGVPIAIILQYGHGTNNGGFVQGRDYINPAIKPIFDKIADEIWKEVTRI